MTIIASEPPYPSRVEDQKYFNLTHRIGTTDLNLEDAKKKARLLEDKYGTIYISKYYGKYRLYWV